MLKQKYGGRQSGTPNAITAQTREMFGLLLSESLDGLKKDLSDLSAKDRVKAIIDIARFILPTLKAVELNTPATDFNPVIIKLGCGINPNEEN